MKASQIIRNIESHIGEKLQCSKRMKAHITWSFQRELDKYEDLKNNLSNLTSEEHNATYNKNRYSTRKRPNTK